MSKVKKFKVKEISGRFGEFIYLGANAENVDILLDNEDGTKQYVLESDGDVDLRKVVFTEFAKENITNYTNRRFENLRKMEQKTALRYRRNSIYRKNRKN